MHPTVEPKAVDPIVKARRAARDLERVDGIDIVRVKEFESTHSASVYIDTQHHMIPPKALRVLADRGAKLDIIDDMDVDAVAFWRK